MKQKNDDQLKQIAKVILLLKNSDTDYCPFCKNESKYVCNPFYMHICDSCGKHMGMNDLIHKTDIDFIVELLKKEFYDEEILLDKS